MAHVGHAVHQAQHAVCFGDDGVLGKQNGGGSSLRSGQLGKHYSRHARLSNIHSLSGETAGYLECHEKLLFCLFVNM